MRRPILSHLVSGTALHVVPGHRAVDIINARRKAGSIVAVIANGKGGSGKSTLTMNMAVGYGLRKLRVLVMDADIEQQTVSKWPLNEPAAAGG